MVRSGSASNLRYTTPFAPVASEEHWKTLGATRNSRNSQKSDDNDEVTEDAEWAKQFDSAKKKSSVLDLRIGVDAPVKSLSDRDPANDWAAPVPDDELQWHAEAAESAKKTLDTFTGSSTSAEEYRAQKAAEAREQRKWELEEIKRQRQRDADREARRQSGENQGSKAYVPPTPSSEARCQSDENQGSKVYVPPTPARRTSLKLLQMEEHEIDPNCSAEEYREKQAEVARKQRELELQEIEKQRRRDKEREAKLAERRASQPYAPPAGRFAFTEPPEEDNLLDAEAFREKHAREARKLRELELQQRELQQQRDAKRPSGESKSTEPYVSPAKTLLEARGTKSSEAEDYRASQAAEARRERQLELAQKEICDQRSSELEAKVLARQTATPS